jgi:hypothetical protein
VALHEEEGQGGVGDFYWGMGKTHQPETGHRIKKCDQIDGGERRDEMLG